jgi:DinB superfamily
MDLVERLNAVTAILRHELSGVTDSALSQHERDRWSIKDVVGHLCDHSHVVHKRLSMMIRLEEPQLEPYDQEQLVRERNANSAPIESLILEFATQRAATVEMLVDLVHWNWARTGRHPAYGKISIRQQVDRWIAHEDEHLAHIRDLVAAGRADR